MVKKPSSPGIRRRLSACFGRAHTNESGTVTPGSSDPCDGGDAYNDRSSCCSDPLSCLLEELRDQSELSLSSCR